MSTVAIGSIAAAGIGAATSLAGSSEQAGAANNAADLQAQEAQNALNFQEQEFNTEQTNQEPFLEAGTGAVNNLSSLLSTPGEGLLTPWTGTFTPPTAAEAAEYPGEQFMLQQGTQAIDENAAATGNLMSGTTGEALENYGENLASTDYSNIYNEALTNYQTAYNTFQQNQGNQFNRLAALAGVGQTSVGQLGQEGQAAATNEGNIDLGTGAEIGQDLENSAYQTASGYNAAGNAFGSALSTLPLYSALSSTNTNGGYGGNPYAPAAATDPANDYDEYLAG